MHSFKDKDDDILNYFTILGIKVINGTIVIEPEFDTEIIGKHCSDIVSYSNRIVYFNEEFFYLDTNSK